MAGSWFFDGVDDAITITANAAQETPTTSLTLAGWLRPGTAGEAANNWPVVQKAFTQGDSPPLSWAINREATGRSTFRASVSVNSTQQITSAFTVAALDAWYFMAVTWTSGAPVTLRIWNAAGTLVTTQQTGNIAGTISYDSPSEPVILGRNTPQNRWWHGHMAYVGAHNTVLSDTDLGTWRTTGVPAATPSAFFLPFDSASAVDTAQGGTVNVSGAVHDAAQSPPVTTSQSQAITHAAESDAAQTVGVGQTFVDPTFVVGLGFQP